MQAIGVLGGTFDPIHRGHLRVATTAYRHLPLSQVRLIPCATPVHKSRAYADAKHRLAMLELAVADEAGLIVDDREIKATTPSYTINTIMSLRQEFPAQPLCLIMGEDSFLSLPEWHDWQKLVSLVHLVVVNRLHQSYEKQLGFTHQLITDPKQLLTQAAGFIIKLPMEPLAVSASEIRTHIAKGENPQQWLSVNVWEYIKQHKLYEYNK